MKYALINKLCILGFISLLVVQMLFNLCVAFKTNEIVVIATNLIGIFVVVIYIVSAYKHLPSHFEVKD